MRNLNEFRDRRADEFYSNHYGLVRFIDTHSIANAIQFDIASKVGPHSLPEICRQLAAKINCQIFTRLDIERSFRIITVKEDLGKSGTLVFSVKVKIWHTSDETEDNYDGRCLLELIEAECRIEKGDEQE